SENTDVAFKLNLRLRVVPPVMVIFACEASTVAPPLPTLRLFTELLASLYEIVPVKPLRSPVMLKEEFAFDVMLSWRVPLPVIGARKRQVATTSTVSVN